MKTKLTLSPVLLSILITMFFSLAPGSPSLAAEIDCFKCHEKLKQGKSVHQALTMGCTTCHTGINASTVPHKKTNKLPKGLSSAPPALCYGCHDKVEFTKKNIHPPIASGGCTTCHAPHSSDEIALLSSKPLDLCAQCHPDTPHGQHISSRQTGSSDGPQDPARPGKPFYCGSCHNPHSTDSPLLFRFNAQSVSKLCLNCHKMN